jgi:menaquinone-dependent protoporphyrinogen oxidase
MQKKIIIYSSTDGQTKLICEKIRTTLEAKSMVDLIPMENVSSVNIDSYSHIIVGASIRYGNHKKSVYNFVSDNIDNLNVKKTAFFSVNAVARKDDKKSPNSNPYVQKFLEQTKWVPDNIGVFAGKINYPKYKFIDKYMIKLIMWITKGPTNTKEIYEFTNWDDVDNFAKNLDT